MRSSTLLHKTPPSCPDLIRASIHLRRKVPSRKDGSPGQVFSPETCPVMTISRRASILIRRNLDQTAVVIAAIDRAQRAAGALSCHRTFLNRHAAGCQMRHHLIRRAGGEKAQIVASRGFMTRREPLDLVGIPR